MALITLTQMTEGEVNLRYNNFAQIYNDVVLASQKRAFPECPNCKKPVIEVSNPQKKGFKKLSCSCKCGFQFKDPKSYMKITVSKTVKAKNGSEPRTITVNINPFDVNECRYPAIFKLFWLIFRAKKGLEPVNLFMFNTSKRVIEVGTNKVSRVDLINKIRNRYGFNTKEFFLTPMEFTKYGNDIITYIRQKGGNENFLGLFNSSDSDFTDDMFEHPEDEQEPSTEKRVFDEAWFSSLDDKLGSIIKTYPEQFRNAVYFKAAAENFRKKRDGFVFSQAEMIIPEFDAELATSIWNNFVESELSVAKYFEKLHYEAPKPDLVKENVYIYVDKDQLREIYAMDPSSFGSDEVNWTIADFISAVKKELGIELSREKAKELMASFSHSSRMLERTTPGAIDRAEKALEEKENSSSEYSFAD